jgi:autotransporter passenger strand-loop-strand repeat protein
LNSGDTLNVYAGGTAIGTTINSGGIEYVYGTATGTTINSGGAEFVYDGGTAIGTTINSGGLEYVYATAIGTTINSGGLENVYATGGAYGTTINSGGLEYVYPGGTSRGTTINSGGTEKVFGNAIDTTINNGLEYVLASGKSAHGTADNVTFGGPQATLELAKPSGLIGTISNWHVGDVIDFLSTAVTSVQENKAHTTLTVTYETNGTASYSLAGQQANTEFQLRSDGNGGTDLILTPIIGVAVITRLCERPPLERAKSLMVQ